MRPSRFPIGQFHDDGVLHWSATGAVRLELTVRRWVPGKGFVRVAALPRAVPSGASRTRLPGKLAGRSVGPGTYSLGLSPGTRAMRCTTHARLVFTVM